MLTVLIGVLYLFRFIFGACVFSFLTVVIYRLPKGENLVYGRSHCPGCGRTLGAGELIPCISYLVQGGKCLGCKMKAVFPDRMSGRNCIYFMQRRNWQH